MLFFALFTPIRTLFLPNGALVAEKSGFLTEKTTFFDAKNLLFLKLFSESAKTKCESAAVFPQKAFLKNAE
ncbi:MAG: hypothetical protein IJ250_02340 [Bacteroidales bacterium]|nr:hypothetical protein [Bacteroidales bacterium]